MIVIRRYQPNLPEKPAFISQTEKEIVEKPFPEILEDIIKNLLKGERKMELKNFLDLEKEKLDTSVASELRNLINVNGEEIARIGEEAKEKAIAEALADLERAIKVKYDLAYSILENGYANLPAIEEVKGE